MPVQPRGGRLSAFLLQMTLALALLGLVDTSGYAGYDTLGLHRVTVRATVVPLTEVAASASVSPVFRLVLDLKPVGGVGIPAEKLSVAVAPECPAQYVRGDSVLVDVARTRLSARTLAFAVQVLDGPPCRVELDRQAHKRLPLNEKDAVSHIRKS
ncbi:hypothetical protein [Cupriavidus pampae]|uniref:Uncharacterized protein n=1 Tax=Cupriavidus pampae TaxID=659251 RepID=A0ABM8XUD9_9BURK|nr:hypothetical protein [Cupriavidus pampae]CAG9183851.1 hypothetical protein LMG32289_05442 [Cupriavidus pampae]